MGSKLYRYVFVMFSFFGLTRSISYMQFQNSMRKYKEMNSETHGFDPSDASIVLPLFIVPYVQIVTFCFSN